MNKREHLLNILAEEAAEVAVAVSKAQRFGLRGVADGASVNNLEVSASNRRAGSIFVPTVTRANLVLVGTS